MHSFSNFVNFYNSRCIVLAQYFQKENFDTGRIQLFTTDCVIGDDNININKGILMCFDQSRQ